ncbi:MAG TPA: sigma-70 family RNA polymerase sigma factor [Terriglobales bacterium]|jgi:RNA polymerase sigma factor (sigma-70 family)|nr:sigma-70 family RNA polymerase sigma factor [Terriglobales bacterium]
MSSTAIAAKKKASGRSDEDLVKRCVAGDEAAWSELIDRYKNLIFSIPIRYGLPREDASDVFQMVCADLVTELPSVQKTAALPAWIIQVTLRKCFRRWRELQRFADDEPEDVASPAEEALPQRLLEELEQEKAVREAFATLTPRCQHLIRMLFFETPCRPYAEVAREMGLSTGSIGFIRGRCLEKMRQHLAGRGIK